MSYTISEIFYSLQGEGRWVGTHAVSVRFSGCNLSCEWCDTDHQPRQVLKIGSLLEQVAAKAPPQVRVVLTGGEPTLQADPVLVRAIRDLDRQVHIETNGTLTVPEGLFDWVTISPKPGVKCKQRTANELKVVYTGKPVAHLLSVFQCDEYYLQPCSQENTEEVIEIIKGDPRWKLSLQIHKYLSIP